MGLERVKEWLGGGVEEYEVDGMLVLPIGDVVVTIREVDWAGHKVVEISAPLAVGVRMGPGLMRLLLELNGVSGLGKFVFVEEGVKGLPTVMYTYGLPEGCGRESFEVAVATVIAMAEKYGGEIVELGGGKPFKEFVSRGG